MTVAFLAARRTQYNADPPRANIVAILILLGSIAIGALLTWLAANPIPIIVMAILGAILMQAPRIAQQVLPACSPPLGPSRTSSPAGHWRSPTPSVWG